MRVMMDDNQIESDIVEKLWQIYSMFLAHLRSLASFNVVATGVPRQLPRLQRRGAIVILGMLALAKRSVLTDHIDQMLKIGLGRFGKVRRHDFSSAASFKSELHRMI